MPTVNIDTCTCTSIIDQTSLPLVFLRTKDCCYKEYSAFLPGHIIQIVMSKGKKLQSALPQQNIENILNADIHEQEQHI